MIHRDFSVLSVLENAQAVDTVILDSFLVHVPLRVQKEDLDWVVRATVHARDHVPRDAMAALKA